MAAQRFRCMEGRCDRYARVTIEDAEGQRARACPRHAVAALEAWPVPGSSGTTPGGSTNTRPPRCGSRRSGPSSAGRTQRHDYPGWEGRRTSLTRPPLTVNRQSLGFSTTGRFLAVTVSEPSSGSQGQSFGIGNVLIGLVRPISVRIALRTDSRR